MLTEPKITREFKSETTHSIIRILLISDNDTCINLIVEILNDPMNNFEVVINKTLDKILNNFSEDDFDVIILDLQLPDSKVLDSFTQLQDKYPDTPIITLTTDFFELIGQQTMVYGAEDYLIKGELNDKILIRSIKKAITRKKSDKYSENIEIKDSEKSTPLVKSKYFNVELLKGYELGLSEIINFLPDATFVIDKLGRVIAWNRAIQELSGVQAGEILGKGNYAYSIPFYGKRRPMLVDMVLRYDEKLENLYNYIKREGDALLAETEILLKGNHRILWIKSVPLYDNDLTITGAIESIRDITEQKRTQKKIETSLEEKNVLLKEIHHRVKNNLQIISSLLGLQESYVKQDPNALKVLKESKNRVLSMAMVHEMLYQSNDMRHINFPNYINKLTRNLFLSYQEKNILPPKIHVDPINLNIETAIPLGLIISELVSNSLKYAFPNIENGEIFVKLNSNQGKYELIISDNGVGFPKNIDYRNTETTLGLKLVNSLINQLDGSIKLDNSNGTKFTIKFKEQEYNKRF